ncbi:uncharacterized protein SPSK_01331 [Sporothrix schenckii 1099-18]|uniref:Uncharacterized protein n=1 Tax=Sporothrix schenckii 1099-18 TaxID=1397361 RepID=A0A0F2LWY1_SPOSC|nr:uncharacterized protein SPSK_01331 [Sporothrix schenckii 1099-18]KJR81364.1 hypothetical protein SPSK_01331 [Sporothrix schenckii 1099-18]
MVGSNKSGWKTNTGEKAKTENTDVGDRKEAVRKQESARETPQCVLGKPCAEFVLGSFTEDYNGEASDLENISPS